MMDYSEIEIKELTIEDAVNDENWNKQPSDVSTFIALDKPIARGLRRATDEEKVQFIDALCAYFLDDMEPNYDNFTTGVALMLDTTTDAHKRRIEAEYLKQYKRFVNGKINGKKKSDSNT